MKWLMGILIAVLMLVPAYTKAFQNEPNGFRDLYWGESLEEIQRTRNIEFVTNYPEDNSASYDIILNQNEPQILSGVSIMGGKLFAHFWNDKLCGISMAFADENGNFEQLKTSMMRLYGPYDLTDDRHIVWIGETTMLFMTRYMPGNTFSVTLFSQELEKQKGLKQASQGW